MEVITSKGSYVVATVQEGARHAVFVEDAALAIAQKYNRSRFEEKTAPVALAQEHVVFDPQVTVNLTEGQEWAAQQIANTFIGDKKEVK